MKKLLLVPLLFLVGIITAAYFQLSPKFPILTGYAAKKACSCHFIANRDIESIEKYDLARSPLNLASLEVNEAEKSVEASLLGLGKSKAYYSNHSGCQLVRDNEKIKLNFSIPNSKTNILPHKKTHYNKSKIDQAIDLAFDENDEWLKQTRALVIIQNDSIIAEHYAPGFDKSTEILGWSMTKSICNALVGILVKEGRLKINQTGLFNEWLTDKRRNISLDHLLRMNSGLEWEEVYDEISPATKMLFQNDNMGTFAANYLSEFEPGSHWEYSSGTTNIISKLIRKQFDSHDEYLAFPYNALFQKLGIESFVMETDASGHYVMSSYCYGTPRDWAKLGMLYLNDGIVNGDTILTKEWIDYSTSPTDNSPQGKYGAHIWLNTNHNRLKDLPSELYSFNGFEGQYVYVIPSKNAVVVRMGLSKGPPFDMNGVMRLVFEGLE